MKTTKRQFSQWWILLGALAGLLLHGAAGWWGVTALAQTSQTFTTSTTRGTTAQSPPDCDPVGSSSTQTTVTTTTTFGPATILIGEDQSQTFFVAAGTLNVNTNTHTQTFQCVAAVSALPLPALLATALLLGGLGLRQLARRRRDTGASGGSA